MCPATTTLHNLIRRPEHSTSKPHPTD